MVFVELTNKKGNKIREYPLSPARPTKSTIITPQNIHVTDQVVLKCWKYQILDPKNLYFLHPVESC